MPAEAPAGRRDPRRGHERGAAGAAPVEEAVRGATGRGWDELFALLDAWRAADRGHGEIAAWLADEQGMDGWWSQAVTVERGRARAAAGGREPRRHLRGQREQDRRGAGRAPLRGLCRPGAARALAAGRPAARAHLEG